jgi:hypothetical protein
MIASHESSLHGPGMESSGAAGHSALYALAHPGHHKTAAPPPPKVFITVSREGGAGGITFSHRLAERLNTAGLGGSGAEISDHGEGAAPPPPWRAWDHELIDKVAAEHGINQSILETIEQRPHSWLDDIFQGLSQSGQNLPAAEMRACRYVAVTIRALATAGHAIVVGQGGVFITANMPGGIHLRLVADFAHRTRQMMETLNLSASQAARRIREVEHNRATFFHRFWPGKTLTPEMFTLTLNVGQMSLDELVECVVPLVAARERPATASTA